MEKAEKKASIKKKIRDTQRLLAREELPETVRLTKERVLKSLQRELQGRQHEERGKKVAKKYRMVKFFERRKVSRRLKSRLRELSTCHHEEEKAEITAEIQRLRKELNYIAHYPDGEKYVALYPSTDTTSAKAIARRDKLMSEVEAAIESGDLLDASEAFGRSALVATGLKPTDKDSDKDTTSHRAVSSETSQGHMGGETVSAEACPATAITSGSRSRCTSGTVRTRVASDDGSEAVPEKTVRRRPLAPVDEEPDSESELYLQSQKKFQEDDFFL